MRLGKKSGNFVGLYIGIEENGNFLQYDGSSREPAKTNYDARARPWYKKAIEFKKAGVSEPYVDFSTKKLVISVSAPIFKNGEIIGVVGSDIFLDTVVNTILNISINEEGFAYLIDEQGKTIIHRDEKLLNTQNKIFEQLKKENQSNFFEAFDENKLQLVSYGVVPITKWKLILQFDKDAISKKINKNLFNEVFLYSILLITILTILFIALIKILSPLKTFKEGLSFFFKYLKGEEKVINKLNIKSNDEFGSMASEIDKEMEIIAKNFSADNLLIEEVKNIVNEIKHGNLNVQIQLEI